MGDSGDDTGQAIRPTSDGGFIIAGSSDSYTLSRGIILSKFDSAGTLMWTKVTRSIGHSTAYDIKQTSDGGYVATGRGFFGGSYQRLFLFKYDQTGNSVWQTRMPGFNFNNDSGEEVQPTSDGGYIVTGSTESYGAGNTDLIIVKFDDSGNISWTRTAGGPSFDWGASVVQTSDGGYVATGQYGLPGGGSNLLLVKFDNAGNLSWAKTVNNTEHGRSVIQTPDGGYMVAGVTSSIGAGNLDLILLKVDGSGNLTWAKTAGGSGGDFERAEIQQTSDGGFIVSGTTSSFGSGGEDLIMAKFDGLGNLSWAKTIGGNDSDWGLSVRQVSDGFIATGQTTIFGDVDILLAKTDSGGNIPGCTSMTSPNPTVTAHSPSFSNPSLTITSPSISKTTPSTSDLTVSPPPWEGLVCSAP